MKLEFRLVMTTFVAGLFLSFAFSALAQVPEGTGVDVVEGTGTAIPEGTGADILEGTGHLVPEGTGTAVPEGTGAAAGEGTGAEAVAVDTAEDVEATGENVAEAVSDDDTEPGAEPTEEDLPYYDPSRVCIPPQAPGEIQPPTDIVTINTPEDFVGSITIGWTPSADDGPLESYVDHYAVAWRLGDDVMVEWTDLEDVPRGTNQAAFEDAELDTPYIFRVTAVSVEYDEEMIEHENYTIEDGSGTLESDAAVSEPFTVRLLPETLAPPADLHVIHSLDDFEGSITLGWTLSPDDEGGSLAVAAYELSARAADATEWVVVRELIPGLEFGVFSNPEPGTDYFFQLRALSPTQGENRVVSEVVETAEPFRMRELPETIEPPTGLQVVDTPEDYSGSIHVQWTPSADESAETPAVAIYRVAYRAGEDSTWYFVEDIEVVEVIEDVEDVEITSTIRSWSDETDEEDREIYFGPDTDVWVRVWAGSALDIARSESWSELIAPYFVSAFRVWSAPAEIGPIQLRSLPDAVEAPANLVAVDTGTDWGGTIDVSWEPSPDQDGGTHSVLYYEVGYRQDDGEADEAEVETEEEADDEWTELPIVSSPMATFDQAVPGVAYTFRVRAVAATREPPSDREMTLVGFEPPEIDRIESDWIESNSVESIDNFSPFFGLGDIAAPTGVEVDDVGWDGGGNLVVTFSSDETSVTRCRHTLYGILVREKLTGDGQPGNGFWQPTVEVERGATEAIVEGLDPDTEYDVRVVAVAAPASVNASEPAGPARPSVNWFMGEKVWIFLFGIIICFFVVWYIQRARKGKALFIRKIAGLEAVDEAIGRATEMGRPILFVPGISDMDNVQTLAGLTILGHVAKMIAEYDTKLDVPVARSLVMTAGREVVRQAYLEAGRPDAFHPDIVHYVTDEQFAYVAAVNGIIVRDEPATCFYQGGFYAESLILAETGNAAGSIQIAGTAMPAQLPFFVAACDYTLIGEELFAASAYLSQDPKQLGSLKGQDVGKAIAMVAIVLGALAASLSHVTGDEGFFADLLAFFNKIF